MKKRKNIIAITCLLLCSAIYLTACHKENEKKEPVSKRGYLKMKVDGVLKQYDTCYASGFQQGLLTRTYYQINVKCGIPGDYSGLYVSDIKPIKAGTYTSAINTETKLPGAGLGAYRPTGTTDIFIAYQAGWPIYEVNVVFTEYNEEYISGTFKGKMRLVGGTKILDITEGEFKSYNH